MRIRGVKRAVLVCSIVGAGVLAAGCRGEPDCNAGSGMKSGPMESRSMDSKGMDPKMSTVWERLGGEANVRKVVDDFVGRAASDPNVNFFRKDVAGAYEWKPSEPQVAHLKQMLVELISSGTGGPLKYTGRDMKSVHRGMRITTAQFNALAGNLDAALRAGGAMDADRSAVMSFAASTAKDIIEVQ